MQLLYHSNMLFFTPTCLHTLPCALECHPLMGVKNVKSFDYLACVQARGHGFRFILYLVHELVGMMSSSAGIVY